MEWLFFAEVSGDSLVQPYETIKCVLVVLAKVKQPGLFPQCEEEIDAVFGIVRFAAEVLGGIVA